MFNNDSAPAPSNITRLSPTHPSNDFSIINICMSGSKYFVTLDGIQRLNLEGHRRTPAMPNATTRVHRLWTRYTDKRKDCRFRERKQQVEKVKIKGCKTITLRPSEDLTETSQPLPPCQQIEADILRGGGRPEAAMPYRRICSGNQSVLKSSK